MVSTYWMKIKVHVMLWFMHAIATFNRFVLRERVFRSYLGTMEIIGHVLV